MQTKQIILILLSIAVAGAILFVSMRTLGPSPAKEMQVDQEAWATFEGYINAAREHDLETLTSLSVQLSPACQDPERIEECRSLMDNVATIGASFKQENFKHTAESDGQVLLYTDYIQEERIILSFIRDNTGQLRVSGIRLCTEGDEPLPECLDPEQSLEAAQGISPETIQENFNNLLR